MPLFLVLFITAVLVYASMHAYLYHSLVRAWAIPRPFRIGMAALFVFMIAAPFAGRALDRAGWVLLGRSITVPGFFWMTWVFWFLMIGLVADAWNTLLRLLSRAFPQLRRGLCPPRPRVLASCLLIAAATVGASIEARHLRIREHRVPIAAWPAGTPSLRLVQVSDVHLNSPRRAAWSRRLTRRVAELNPDLVVSTGDMVDAPPADIADQARDWAAVRPALGKFAVLGNHDYYSGWRGSVEFHRQAGFRLLRGEATDVGHRLRLAGLDDPTGRHLGVPCSDNPALFNTLPLAPGRFTLLLRHQPFATLLPQGVLDLQVSGHTHAGQVFPFQWFVRLFYPHSQGWYSMGTARLYVSAGTGTWGPPLRLFAPPEITVFVLEPK
jgi:predicted MPP superfamily phosphohydrolase